MRGIYSIGNRRVERLHFVAYISLNQCVFSNLPLTWAKAIRRIVYEMTLLFQLGCKRLFDGPYNEFMKYPNAMHSICHTILVTDCQKFKPPPPCMYVLRTNTGQSVRIHLISERN